MEPILEENKGRFVVFPIQHDDIWQEYKKSEASFWTAEEIDFSADKNDWLELEENEQILEMIESGATDNFKREKAEADRESKKELASMNNLNKIKVEELKDDKDIEDTKLNVLSRMAVEEMKKGED